MLSNDIYNRYLRDINNIMGMLKTITVTQALGLDRAERHAPEEGVVEIPVVVKVPGFCCSTGIPPQLGSPLVCFRISLFRRFIPPRLSDEHSKARTGGAGALPWRAA